MRPTPSHLIDAELEIIGEQLDHPERYTVGPHRVVIEALFAHVMWQEAHIVAIIRAHARGVVTPDPLEPPP